MELLLEKLKRIYRFLFKNPPKYECDLKCSVERHGTIYGGWNILPNSLDANSIVYSFGIGEDISFDLSIINRYGCKVYGFDPTPRVKDWLEQQTVPTDFLFSPIALSDKDGTLQFYTPENESDISHKAIASKNSKILEVSCQSLKTIMDNYNHVNIDLLKMDIEGFEYDVLDNLLSKKIYPKQLLIEFHHFFPEIGNAKTELLIKKLKLEGFKLFNVADSFCEYSFAYQP